MKRTLFGMARACALAFTCLFGGALHLAGLVDVRPLTDPESDPSAFPLVQNGIAAPLVLAGSDLPGVSRASRDLQLDIERVTAVSPQVLSEIPRSAKAVVIIGTIGSNSLVDHLIDSGRLDVSGVTGVWEAFVHQTLSNPFPGIDHALVIAGADRRGTIYGIYTLSEQIGVSPWYWWADVPVKGRDELHLKAGRRTDAPAVQYRGIFLNDEAPALSGWAHEKFGGFNHRFYSHVFELILRLRGNYLWPAMWGNAFSDDDPLNPQVAHEYGIVMGTSHHEPLMRAHDEWRRYGQGPWNYNTNAGNLREFWRSGLQRVEDFDQIISIGMRGDGDEAMSEETNTALLERIVRDQREIIAEVKGKPAHQVPQLWALYKEVQAYYEHGMRVPDDVILLWCDDNWGNIRRLPTPEEQNRPGGAGVYYHFDYVGGPRNYKWLNLTPLPKVWEQMHLAWQYQARRIWIVNVGDLKPMEFPIDFFLTYAWNPEAWPYQRIEEFSRRWAAQVFGDEHAEEAAYLLSQYPKLNRHRTPELMEPGTYSLHNYWESERILTAWRDLVARSQSLQEALPPESRSAFSQLIGYPVEASAVIRELYDAAGRNALYAFQGRHETNYQAQHVRALFERDAELADAYHALSEGKWNHFMSQINIGYTYWQQPPAETMPAVQEVRPNRGPVPALSVEGTRTAWPVWGAPAPALPPLDALAQNTRWIEVFNRGDQPLSYVATGSHPWLEVQPASGFIHDTTRLHTRVDWASVPEGDTEARIDIETGDTVFQILVPVHHRKSRIPAGFSGFVESDGCVAIDAIDFSRMVAAGGAAWRTLPDFGRTRGGVTVFPVTAANRDPGPSSPCLEYDIYLFEGGEFPLELHLAPSLDFQSGEGLRIAVSMDDGEPEVLKVGTWETLQSWEKAVSQSIRRISTTVDIHRRGEHTLKIWMVTPGVVLERVIIDTGGLRPSYLGPPSSPRLSALD